MEKRLVLAVALSFLVIFAWSRLTPKHPSAPSLSSEQPSVSPKPADPIPALSVETPALKIVPEQEYKFNTDLFSCIFWEPQAAIKTIKFNKYQDYDFNLEYGLAAFDPNLSFSREAVLADSVTYKYIDQDKALIKKVSLSKSNYGIDLELKIANLSSSVLKLKPSLILGKMDFAPKRTKVLDNSPGATPFWDVTVASQDKTSYPNPHKDIVINGLKFIGLRDRYFCAVIAPETSQYAGYIKRLSGQESEVGIIGPEIELAAKQEITHKFRLYIGPQDVTIISKINPEWSSVVYFGKFNFIGHALLGLLQFFHIIVRNWGLAIIVLSLFIFIILFPLTLKQMRSMKEMQILQPKIEQLRKNYKDNPQRLNKEIMELYKEHKVNPLSGCLPLILQMPVFFALYQVLSRSIALKGAQFLWIKDLSEPDKLFLLPFNIPLLGNEFNLLPILMAIGMFIQQKTTAQVSSGVSAEQQKIFLVLLPIMFGVLFYHMPAGLVLYWFVNSTLMLVYQLKVVGAK